ncbi:TlpA family protein disulfide reductase [Anaerobacillus sp. CMMVII]|uniref:TlpA family protein disulfide reductase n=1 Tax=Anaerobacillus sp. CMMVII TaxID=2755588 RepID=UPI0021B7B736|nr:TlpA disulfide reductase family protein [Anaerobacillus sp. CMMVII]MCT8139916.1 TlpA family protein disulfide reductase [Anaerobacillus sp. CMMVII]
MGQKQQSFEMNTGLPTLPLVGYQAPSFSLETFEGELVSFDDDLVGRPMLINFWASWCPPCRAEMPDLVEVAKQYEEQISFIGINVATQDTNSQSQAFLDEFHVPYPNLVDKTGAVARLYQVPPIPATLVIDKNGQVVFRKLGGMTKSEIIAAVQRVIEGSEPDAR